MRKLYLGVLCIWLMACSPNQTPTPIIPTETNTPTPPVPTATTVWFPATEIPTSIPTIEITPTENYRLEIGSEIFIDVFDDPAMWNETKSNGANVSVIGNGINFVLSNPYQYLFSYRNQPILDDFYLEATANLSICKGNNEYGVLIRASSAPSYYRVAFNCLGEASVTLLLDGNAHLAVENEAFAFLPKNTPDNVIIGIWAKGNEIRFFANDIFLFSVDRANLYSGSVGFFVRSRAEDAISVQYQNLGIYTIE